VQEIDEPGKGRLLPEMPSTSYLKVGLSITCAAAFFGGMWSLRAESVPAAPAPAPAAEFAVITQPEMEDGYLKIGFDRLAGFKFVPPEFDPAANPNVTPPTGNEQIPDIVKSWNGKKAVVTGFMLPTKLEKGKCTEFLLMISQMACCFGATPNINDWIVVRIPQGVPVMMDVPVSFYGVLKVGATFENGYLTGIYELEGERMGEVKG
jgi:hypothetical protein